jgi:hypothetical protein
MRSLPEASRAEPLSAMEVVRAGLIVTGFVVCSVIFAKVAYAAVALFLHGTTYAAASLF